VNGRTTYWGNSGKIPGGVSYENFELQAPFSVGQEFWFGVTPDEPGKLGFDPEWGRSNRSRVAGDGSRANAEL